MKETACIGRDKSRVRLTVEGPTTLRLSPQAARAIAAALYRFANDVELIPARESALGESVVDPKSFE